MSKASDPRSTIIGRHLQESADIQRQTAEVCQSSILEAADLIAMSFRNGGKLMLCGNGGSAADCQHLAAEFTSRLSADFPRPALPAIALTTDTSFLTAYANDFDFDGIFARQIEAIGKPSDVLIGISTSGNSANVIRAFQAAKTIGIVTVGLTGAVGGELRQLCQACVCIPSESTQHIQEAHLAVEHIICHIVERAIFGDRRIDER